MFRTLKHRKSSHPLSPCQSPKLGRSSFERSVSKNLSSSVISIDFNESVPCEDVDIKYTNSPIAVTAIVSNNNNLDDENVVAANDEDASITEPIDVVNNNQLTSATTEQCLGVISVSVSSLANNQTNSSDFDTDTNHTPNIYVDLESNLSDQDKSKSCSNLHVHQDERNDSKNNLLMSRGDYRDSRNEETFQSKQMEETVKQSSEAPEHLKTTEKLSFANKLRNRIRKSSSTENNHYASIERDETLRERFKQKLSKGLDNYRPLSEIENKTEDESLKASGSNSETHYHHHNHKKHTKCKKRRRRLFRQKTEERDLVKQQNGEDEHFEEINNPDDLQIGRTRSLMTQIREMKKNKSSTVNLKDSDKQSRARMENLLMAEQMANRLSEIKFLFESDAKEIRFEEMIECQSALESLTELTVPEDGPNDTVIGSHSLVTHHYHHSNLLHNQQDLEFISMPPRITGRKFPVTDLDDDFGDIEGNGLRGGSKAQTDSQDFSSDDDVTVSEPKKNFKRLAQNFKSRFKFKIRKSKKSKNCKICSRKIRPIHPSPTVVDFDKKFHVSEMFDDDDFCKCDANFDEDQPTDIIGGNKEGLIFNVRRNDSSGSSNVSTKSSQ